MNNTIDDQLSMSDVSLLGGTNSPTVSTNGESSQSGSRKRKAVAIKSLRSQEKIIDNLKKENFDLKLQLNFLMERLNQMSPENCEKLNQENIKLRAGVQSLSADLKESKEIISELNEEINDLQNQHECPSCSNQSDSESAENELEQLKEDLQDKEVELQNKRDDFDRLKTHLDHIYADYDDLQNEYEILKKKASSNPSSDNQTDDLIKAVQELEEDNEKLVAALQSRNQDVAALDAEVEKLLSHLDEKGMDGPVNKKGVGGPVNERGMCGPMNEKVIKLEEALQEREEVIQEREDEIDILKKELKTVTESHDEDIKAFEEHMAKAQAEFNEQRQLNQELVEELENTKKYCQDDLTKQYNDMIVSIRERDVRLASLQGNFEQQADTMEREKDLLLEDIVELKDTIHELFDALNRQEENVIELKNQVRRKEEDVRRRPSSEEFASTIQRHQEELDAIQRERNEARDENQSLQAGYRDMEKKYHIIRKKKYLLTKLLEEHQIINCA
ncbi:microtubule associated-domain-containing protein [Mucor mucedo]|uniref:microtubule associated-domain-containing protein n=1 Tax=Mucor mucedo TaxID=29922 RepID=UPI00221EF642|nr:microtubule associated-domain-containing protein [Mucor mucedo]KAI7896640.1 microtubule associated-domain-containing protein [Mucor mucedo]